MNITKLMTELVFQVAIILFAAKVGGMIMKKIKMPSVLGELLIGILIGPYILGGIAFPGFPHGFFPLAHGFAISPELYGFATVASIILLFLSGLETDLSLFLAYSVKGAIIGVGGVLAAMISSMWIGSLMLHTSLFTPENLFLGILSIATSVGITARILSEQRKMGSPEGVTILAAAVIDDVLGIIMLAVVLGIIAVMGTGGGEVAWSSIVMIAFKAVVVWLGFTILGLIFARRISKLLKIFKGESSIAIMALGLALLLSGIFEEAGLAMIIGAYVMGLSLSRTDISYVIQEKLEVIHDFFVPIFFCTMGMMVDVDVFSNPRVIIFGLIYSVVSIFAKIIGCGGPALFLNFNKTGALRIGMGMVPRGEVALIIAGIGLAQGILDKNLFGVAVMMTLITTIAPPPILTALLKINKRGTRKEVKGQDRVDTFFEFPSRELMTFATGQIIEEFESQGYFVHEWDVGYPAYQIRREDIFITLNIMNERLEFVSDIQDVHYLKTLVYEKLLEMQEIVNKLKELAKPKELGKELLSDENTAARREENFFKDIPLDCIKLNLESNDKDSLIKELMDLAHTSGQLIDLSLVSESVFAREASMSTGMQKGIALPHGKSDGVDHLVPVVGIHRGGIDFDSLDGEPSRIFFMVLSPKNVSGPHVRYLAAISGIMSKPEMGDKILACKTARELRDLLVTEATS
jgi:Kef-type K+ transport system membrane component KefB/mannitol/fructose-specific phosphotransferase system IIA component (Ntr-type)